MANQLLREVLGSVLRAQRQEIGLTLRQVSNLSLVSLGYLSEVERGQKEVSSEVLNSICEALGTTLGQVLSQATLRVVSLESSQRSIGIAA